MATVKKVGFVDGILPSSDELQSIQLINIAARKIIGRRDQSSLRNPDWDLIRREWHKVKYYRQSKALSKLLAIVFNRAVYNASTYDILERYYNNIILKVWGSPFDAPEQLLADVHRLAERADNEPVKLEILGSDNDWIFKGFHYSTEGPYSDEQFRLLILEEFDKERQHFERLKRKHESAEEADNSRSRPRIPENVRIEVWRRDGGKCIRCGSRDRLEYDHIIPISKGGSNTARNIELLCESCNRSKSDKIQ